MVRIEAVLVFHGCEEFLDGTIGAILELCDCVLIHLRVAIGRLEDYIKEALLAGHISHVRLKRLHYFFVKDEDRAAIIGESLQGALGNVVLVPGCRHAFSPGQPSTRLPSNAATIDRMIHTHAAASQLRRAVLLDVSRGCYGGSQGEPENKESYQAAALSFGTSATVKPDAVALPRTFSFVGLLAGIVNPS